MQMGEKRFRILCVDDEEMNNLLYRSVLTKAGYDVLTVESGAEALTLLEHETVDLVILDLMMPDMDGLTVLARLKAQHTTDEVHVIVSTAISDRETKLKVLEAGANDYLSKPLDRAEMLLRVNNLIQLKHHQDIIKRFNSELKLEVSEKTQELRSAYLETIHRLVMASEFKDTDTADHIKRVSHYARHLAVAAGLSEPFVETIYYAAPMHDIGKIGIPDHILTKPGSLTTEEVEVIRQHTVIGARIINGSTSPVLQMAEDIALSHHEHWDGSGYPHGLGGDQIPVAGRIVALVDVYDALRMRRPYKPAFSHDEACRIILRGDRRTEPVHFDPHLLTIFAKDADQFDAIFSAFSNQSGETL